MKTGKWDDYVVEKIKKESDMGLGYLKEALKPPATPGSALVALGHIAKAQGVSERELAERTGLSQPAINKMFRTGNAKWGSVFDIVVALGFGLTATKGKKPIQKKQIKPA